MLGFLIVSVVMTIFSFALLGSLAALGSSEPVMPRSAVLKLDMSTIALTEQSADSNPFEMLQKEGVTKVGIWNAIQAIDAAAADPAVSYIYMKPDMLMSSGMAEVEELRSALENFRRSGKARKRQTQVRPRLSLPLAENQKAVKLPLMVTAVGLQAFFKLTGRYYPVIRPLIFLKRNE